MRIANVLVSDVWGSVTPDALERGIGGREGALLHLSREWARLGHEVTCFVNVERGTRFPEMMMRSSPWLRPDDSLSPPSFRGAGFHEYVPLRLARPMLSNFDWDAVVAWECPSVFAQEGVAERCKIKICEMQVAHFGPAELEAAQEHCDYVAALSDWHGGFLKSQGLQTAEEDEGAPKIVVLPNGVDISRYPRERALKVPPKSGWRFVYSSSPDRGLWHLLRAWKDIRKLDPTATLGVAYGVADWVAQARWSHNRIAEMALEIEMLMSQPGVQHLGKIGQGELAQHQLNAHAWPYPLDSIQATESGCISAVENAAAGNPIITTDCDCMEEEFGGIGRIVPLPMDDDGIDRFVEAFEEIMRGDEDIYDLMRERGREFAESRDWSLIAPRWIELFAEGG